MPCQPPDSAGTTTLCDRLEKECGQDITAATERVPVYLNSGLWKLAIASAKYVHELYPDHDFPLAFGLFEDGDRHEALVHFLHAAIKYPRAARMLTGVRRGGRPKSNHEVEDHNTGVTWLRDLEPYLRRWSSEAKAFFRSIVQSPDVVALIDEAKEARKTWLEGKSPERSWFERMQEMESLEFARQQAERLGALVD